MCTTQRSNAGDFVLLTGEYPPYTSESIDAFGIASQIVAEALEASDCGVEMSFKPWARALAEAGNDQANGTFPWAFTEERAETFLYSDPLYNAGIYLFARAGDEIDFKADEDLQGLDLCLPISYSDKRVQPMVEAGIVTLSRPQDMDACYRMLAGGRTDLVVNNDAVGKAEITRLFGSADDFKILPNALRTTVHHVLVSKTHPDAQTLLAAVNGGLAKLKEQGRIEEIFLEQLQ
ncbi:MAG: transporter substrate-binding domain-containing protein [Pseudomonadota bacterium]